MRILHTADWHFGKNLEGNSRISEQKLFADELCDICDEKNIDVVIIAGDIYDTFNPPWEAEALFYSTVKKLSNHGERFIIAISGNHDSPNRISASSPIASELGIILLGSLNDVVPKGKYGQFSIVDSGNGFIEIEKNNENAIFILIPYPSEKNLNKIISTSLDEVEFQKNYSEKINSILKELSKKYRDDTINIIVSHFFINGGISSNSERNIQLGGSYAVLPDVFPYNTHYVAMGHLHRPQQIKSSAEYVYYSGSPIQYSKSEAGHSKSVFVADIIKEKGCIYFEKVPLTNYKPIEIWKAESIEHAISLCTENSKRECWVFLSIKSDHVLLQSEIKKLHEIKKDIVEVSVFFDDEEEKIQNDIEEKTLEEQFSEFYFSLKGKKPENELIKMFLEISSDYEEESDIETDNS